MWVVLLVMRLPHCLLRIRGQKLFFPLGRWPPNMNSPIKTSSFNTLVSLQSFPPLRPRFTHWDFVDFRRIFGHDQTRQDPSPVTLDPHRTSVRPRRLA